MDQIQVASFYRFTPVGPSSAAGVVGACFAILFLAWIYITYQCRGFLKFSVYRLFLFCIVSAIGYFLKIACNNHTPTETSTEEEWGTYVNLYLASNTMTSVGNFFFFTALLSVTNTWVEKNRDPVHEAKLVKRDHRFFLVCALLTVTALILTVISGTPVGNNQLRVAGNSILVALVALLLLIIGKRSMDLQLKLTHPRSSLIPKVLFICTLLLLLTSAFKLYQSVCDYSSPALHNIVVIYILQAFVQLVIMIILTIFWVPVFYVVLSDTEPIKTTQLEAQPHPNSYS